MRIISGTHKGRRIHAPKQLPVRPTTDMAKEGLFNILSHRFHLPGLTVIDLYAGTGNISYEFASRGVTDILCVDAHRKCIQFIEKTAADLDFGIRALKSETIPFLENSRIRADIIFGDPPYVLPAEEFTKLAGLVFERQLLLEGGLLILEHSRHISLTHIPHFGQERRYGGSVFSFFGN